MDCPLTLMTELPFRDVVSEFVRAGESAESCDCYFI